MSHESFGKYLVAVMLSVGLTGICSVSSAAGIEDDCDIRELLTDFSQYKTTNNFHHGHPVAHAIWSGKAIRKFKDDNSFWVQGVKDENFPLLVLGATLHDIGKAGTCSKMKFSTKPKHPQLGFDLLLQKKQYRFCESKQSSNLVDYFSKDRPCKLERREIIAVSVMEAMHYDLGNVLQGKLSPRDWNRLFNQRLSHAIEAVVKVSPPTASGLGITKDFISQLVLMALAVSAADVRGADQVEGYDAAWPHYQMKPTDVHINKVRRTTKFDHLRYGGARAQGIRDEIIRIYQKKAPASGPHGGAAVYASAVLEKQRTYKIGEEVGPKGKFFKTRLVEVSAQEEGDPLRITWSEVASAKGKRAASAAVKGAAIVIGTLSQEGKLLCETSNPSARKKLCLKIKMCSVTKTGEPTWNRCGGQDKRIQLVSKTEIPKAFWQLILRPSP